MNHRSAPGELLEASAGGLRCAVGGFHVDPGPEAAADEAVITHAHGDHLRPGSARYHCVAEAAPILRRRLGDGATVIPHAAGERFTLGDAAVSFHPAGHVLGSAQVRVEAAGAVWVVSGDYKRAPDPTCAPFEPVRCDTFVTEATFALPIFRWDPTESVAREILAWWERNAAARRPSVLFCYALGKAQRILAELARLVDPASGRRVLVHGMIEPLNRLYRDAGVPMLPTELLPEAAPRRKSGKGAGAGATRYPGELILAPPVAMATPWMRRFGDCETGFASGFMRVRGTRRRRGFDRGFVLSDHADWPALLATVEESGARRVLVTHGYKDVLTRHLRERGVDAAPLRTGFEGEADIAQPGS